MTMNVYSHAVIYGLLGGSATCAVLWLRLMGMKVPLHYYIVMFIVGATLTVFIYFITGFAPPVVR